MPVPGHKVTRLISLAFVLVLMAAAASRASGSSPLPNVSVRFTATITAPCEYDIDYSPQEITMELASRSGNRYPLLLKLKDKALNASGVMAYVFEGYASFPAGSYDTRWPNAKFVARIWRFKDSMPGYYPGTAPCARRERKAPGLESKSIVTFPESSFLGFPAGTSTTNFSTSLVMPGTLQPPQPVCPETGCK